MQVSHHTPLAPLTTLGLGGPAATLLTATTEAELVAAVAAADGRGEPVLVLGGGSNVVLPDRGVDGTVVCVRTTGMTLDGPTLTAQAGEGWDAVVASAVDAGLAGLECLAGIPGLVGATPVQNVGAYGQEVAQTVTAVRAYDRRAGDTVELAGAACAFSYRSSVFKRDPGRYVVLAVSFGLRPGNLSEPVAYAELARSLGVAVGGRVPLGVVPGQVVALRRRKGMVVDAADPDSRSVGSFFTNPLLTAEDFAMLQARAEDAVPHWPGGDGRVKVSAAWLVQHAGYGPGYGAGPVRVSGKHALALTHRGGGTAAALLTLAREIRDGVRARYGVELVAEPVLVDATL